MHQPSPLCAFKSQVLSFNFQAFIGRAMENDTGANGSHKHTFSYFSKIAINCHLSGDAHLWLVKAAKLSGQKLITVFWNGYERMPTSAICIFQINKIVREFDGEKFAKTTKHMPVTLTRIHPAIRSSVIVPFEKPTE